MKNQVFKVISIMATVVLLITGCTGTKKVLIDSQTLYVTTKGHRTEVHDLVSNQSYTFTTKRVRRSEGIPEPITAVSTNNMAIETLGNVLRITDKGSRTVYIIRFGRGVYHHGEKDF